MWVMNECMLGAELGNLTAFREVAKKTEALQSPFYLHRNKDQEQARILRCSIPEGLILQSNESEAWEQQKPIPPCQIMTGFYSMLPTKRKTSKGQACYNREEAFSYGL